MPRKARKRVPSQIEANVLRKSRRRCCVCFGINREIGEKIGQVAHLDHNPNNFAEDNLAFLCLEHHTIYDSRSSQHKNFTIEEVKSYRAELHEDLRTQDHIATVQRAYVKMSPMAPGLVFLPGDQGIRVEFQVRNFGRTPANVTDIVISVMWLLSGLGGVPAQPQYVRDYPDHVASKAPLVADDFFFVPRTYPAANFPPGVLAEIKAGKRLFCVFGCVQYTDAFGVAHQSGVGRWYDYRWDIRPDGVSDERWSQRSNLAFIASEEYNYDRKLGKAAKKRERPQQADELLAKIAKLEARIAPRLLTQTQQNELTEKLSGLERQRVTIVASPSTPESEWFARILGAPLRAAGWDTEILPGTVTATVLYPRGIILRYDAGPAELVQEAEATGPGRASTTLAKALAELGIDATALPAASTLMAPSVTIQITISPK